MNSTSIVVNEVGPISPRELTFDDVRVTLIADETQTGIQISVLSD